MGFILSIIALLISVASLVFYILVLIKLFQEKGVLHGILGLICGIYTFIWGWMNADRLGIRNIMLYWTICIVIAVVFNLGAGAMQ